MASRDKLAAIFAALGSNGNWRQYVSTLQAAKDEAVTKLLMGPTADEALRGEARAYHELLNDIRINTKDT